MPSPDCATSLHLLAGRWGQKVHIQIFALSEDRSACVSMQSNQVSTGHSVNSQGLKASSGRQCTLIRLQSTFFFLISAQISVAEVMTFFLFLHQNMGTHKKDVTKEVLMSVYRVSFEIEIKKNHN